MHTADCEIGFDHLFGKPFNLFFAVAEDDSLRNRETVVQIAQSIEFVLLLFDRYEILFDSLECQFISLDQDLNWVLHELITDR